MADLDGVPENSEQRLADALEALIKIVEHEFGFEDSAPSPNFPELTAAREALAEVRGVR